MGFGFGMFSIMEALFPIFFILIFGMVAFVFISSAVRGVKNHHSPRLSVPAKVVSKQQRHYHHHHGALHTSYYVTFEVDSGDRMELQLHADEYGMLAEGDVGTLQFQGTRFLDFQRNGNL